VNLAALTEGAEDVSQAWHAGRSGIRVSTATGYRMPPLHPRPALGDCLAVCRHALAGHPPGKVIIGGCPRAATSSANRRMRWAGLPRWRRGLALSGTKPCRA
jgi:hypothetical protein